MDSIFGYFLDERFKKEAARMLKLGAYGRKLPEFLRQAVMRGILLVVLVLSAGFYLEINYAILAAVAVAALFLPFLAGYFILAYRYELRKRQIEKLVPDALLQASAFPKGTALEKIVGYLAGADYGALSAEFARLEAELEKGASMEEAVENMKQRNSSAILNRALGLLLQGYRSGADMGDTFKEAAEDLLETNSILRERVSTLVIEKYTLILAGGIIVPLVLGMLVGLVSGLNFSSMSILQLGLGIAERKALLASALIANQVYIAEYAIIASVFVANQESNLKKAVVYAFILLPLSLVTYNLAQFLV